LVSRWTSKWLDGNTTWVIGITKDAPFIQNWPYGLVGRTIHILSSLYAGNSTLRFGLVDFKEDELIKEALVGQKEPIIIMIHQGKVYGCPTYKEAYN
jgi:hypothetical protein